MFVMTVRHIHGSTISPTPRPHQPAVTLHTPDITLTPRGATVYSLSTSIYGLSMTPCATTLPFATDSYGTTILTPPTVPTYRNCPQWRMNAIVLWKSTMSASVTTAHKHSTIQRATHITGLLIVLSVAFVPLAPIQQATLH